LNNDAKTHFLPASQRALRWIVTVCWAGLIFGLSTKTYGASFTEVMLHRLLDLVHIQLSPAHFEALHFIVRKSAHFTEYGILSLLLFASISEARKFEWQPRAAMWSIVIAGLYSLTDEFHQMFVPGRGPSIKDCGIDTAGAAAAMLVVYLGNRRGRANEPTGSVAEAPGRS